MGWVGNLFIFYGLWLVGNKQEKAFAFTIIGESVWVFHSLSMGLYDLAFVCFVFVVVAARNWRKWRKDANTTF